FYSLTYSQGYPQQGRQPRRCEPLLRHIRLIPDADIRIGAFTTADTIRTQGVDVVFMGFTGAQIKIGTAPGVLLQGFDISGAFPVARNRCNAGFGNQRFQTLFSGGIDEVINAVEFESRLDGLEVRLDFLDPRLISTIQYRRGHDTGEQTNDDDHHHDLDQAETRLPTHSFVNGYGLINSFHNDSRNNSIYQSSCHPASWSNRRRAGC